VTISLCERLEERRQSKPDALAYIIDGVERSNLSSIDRVFRIANGLIAAGHRERRSRSGAVSQ
jgi:hypothetical protein